MILASCCYIGVSAQDTQHSLRFYEMLAHKDASYEHSFQMMNHQDEQDYWADQQDFERDLGMADFASYLIYMKGKKDAYLHHLQSCESCIHSEVYLKMAREYLSATDFDRLLKPEASEMVQNVPKKRQN
ncbi:MAG: hypothetical protein AB3N18_13980 [Allomuricauda sp.]